MRSILRFLRVVLPTFCPLVSVLRLHCLPPLPTLLLITVLDLNTAANRAQPHLSTHTPNPALCACGCPCVSLWCQSVVCLSIVGRVCARVCVCTRWAGLLPLVSPLPPPSLNTPGSRASTASAAAVLSSSSSASSSRPRHHKSLSSSNHPCPSDLHAPRPRQVSLASSHHPSSINLKGRGN